MRMQCPRTCTCRGIVRLLLSALAITALTTVTFAQHRTEPNVLVSAAAAGIEPREAQAMEEMLRGISGKERRWMQRPRLVVVTTVMAFAEGARSAYQTVDAHLSEDEARKLVDDLTAGLTLLSGRTFERFSSVRFETPAPGCDVSVVRDGDIVVGRFRGVRALLKAVGYGGRTARADGTITSGTVMLDEEYDATDQQQNLLRMHELGHALGYNHVESLRSIMNATLGVQFTDFDRRVARVAFSHLTPDRPQPELLARTN